MADKQINVKVKADTDTTKLNDLKHEMDKLKAEKIQLKVEAKTEELHQAEAELNQLKSQLNSIESLPPHIRAKVEKVEVDNLKSEISSMENKVANLRVDVDMAELEAVKSEMQAIESDPINVQLETQTAMEALGQIADGFSRVRQSASEIGQSFTTALQAQAKQDTNRTFLSNALQDAQKTEQVMGNINTIIAKLPGDDTALQGLLSSAVAMEPSLANNQQLLTDIANSATDYFSAMSFYGKSAVEAQQDMTNYLLTGNTAELERSPILQGHIKELKEASTIQERQAVLAKALNDEHWGGMGQAKTLNNAMETFNSMLERGQYNMGALFQPLAMWGMETIGYLDEISGGAIGVGIALAGFASPLAEGLMGVGQMATGIKALKDVADFGGIIGKLTPLKTALLDVASSAKTLALDLLTAGKNALIAGANAVKSGAMWLIEKASKIASSIASYALATAQWVLNSSLLANPLTWIVLALIALAVALVWAYQNVDWFREMVDNAWASVSQFAGALWNNLVSAFNYVTGVIANFTNSIGLNSQDWKQAILGFILFLPTLPMKIGEMAVNAIAKALGFGSNFTNRMKTGAKNAVDGFINKIKEIKNKIQAEFDAILQKASSFAMQIADTLTFGGASMVAGWLSGSGEHSPGFMYDALSSELQAMLGLPGQFLGGLVSSVSSQASNMANGFSEALVGMSLDEVWESLFSVEGVTELITNFINTIVDSLFVLPNMITEALMGISFEEFVSQLTGVQFTVDGLKTSVTGAFSWITSTIQTQMSLSITGVQMFINFIMGLPTQLMSILNSAISRVTSFASSIVSQLRSAGSNAVSQFRSAISSLSNALSSELSAMISEATNFIGTIGSKLYSAGVNAVSSFLNGLDSHSPGKMQRTFVWEITEMGRRTPIESRQLIENVGKLGRDIVDEFGTPKLRYDFEVGNTAITNQPQTMLPIGNTGDTIINIYGDVDNDKRVQEIVDAVRRELAWDNKTAGRTI